MQDLFQQATATGQAYTAKDIEVLEGLEPVRRRPAMYIGGTDERALHHLVAELLDNAMDEAVAGHASRIELRLDADGAVTVRDNGRGIPIEPHPKFPKKSALEVILTTLHSAVGDLRREGGSLAMDAYRQRCLTIGRDVTVSLPTGESLSGRAVGVGDDGHLHVRTAEKTVSVAAGDVIHATI